ncbi:MAG: M48 family metalloprotease [bacterium]|nr:M48 family metalloprotease [bacterium]
MSTAMNELLLWFGANNLVLSLAIALAAWVAQRILRSPVLAHLLWLLVLVKLVTPPLVTLPVLPAPAEAIATPTPTVIEPEAVGLATSATFLEVDTVVPVAAGTFDLTNLTAALVATWLLGSFVVLAVSLRRIRRFHRALTLSARPAGTDVQRLARELAERLGLRHTPTIHLTSAQVSPMVWWIGGAVRVFLPAELPERVTRTDLRWVLAHELAHVRRRDHLVRWLEWFACVLFWWNPIAWWARRNLRANEEVCCDALVLRTFTPTPHTYANSLLTVVEFLATPALRPPAMASEINSGGFLERRFRMIVGKTPVASTPRWAQALVLVLTALVMPLGVAVAQDPDVKGVGVRIRRAVQAGELTPKQARKLMQALRELEGEHDGGDHDRARRERDRALAREQAVRADVEAQRQLERALKAERAAAARANDREILKRTVAERRDLEASMAAAKDQIAQLRHDAKAKVHAERARHKARVTELEQRLAELQNRHEATAHSRLNLEADRNRLELERKHIEAHHNQLKERKLQLEAERSEVRARRSAELLRASELKRRTGEEMLRRGQQPERQRVRRAGANSEIERLRRDLARRTAELHDMEARIHAEQARRETEVHERNNRRSVERDRRDARLNAVKKKLGAEMKAGRLSREDAKKKLEAIQRDVDRQAVEMQKVRAEEALNREVHNLEMRNRSLRDRAERDRRNRSREVRARRDVERQEHSNRRNGERRSRERRQDQRGRTEALDRLDRGLSSERRRRATATANKLTAARDKLAKAIAERALSAEDAKKKLDTYRRDLIRHQHEDDIARFVDARRQLTDAVEAGKLSRENAAAKLRYARDQFTDQRKKELALVTRSTRLTDAARKIEAAVKSGDLSKADAKKKLTELKRRLQEAEAKAAKAQKNSKLKASKSKRRVIR